MEISAERLADVLATRITITFKDIDLFLSELGDFPSIDDFSVRGKTRYNALVKLANLIKAIDEHRIYVPERKE